MDTLSQGFSVVGAGLSIGSRNLVLRALPGCHLLESKLDSWRTSRFCRLIGPAILIVDYEALLRLECEQLPAVEYLSNVEVLVLCEDCNDEAYDVALSAGCSGMLKLDSSSEFLQQAVSSISDGILWYPRRILSKLARQFILSRSISQKSLTIRETEILRLLGMEQKNQAIADQLCISRETVRWHLRTLYSKIGVKNRLEAQLYALKHRGDADHLLRHEGDESVPSQRSEAQSVGRVG